MTSLNPLELSIVRAGLAGGDPVRAGLRNQIPHLDILSREFTGVGFFARFSPLEHSLKVDTQDFEITNIEGKTPELDNGFGCILFIKNGQLGLIECFTYDETWPDNLSNYRIEYE